MISGSHGQPRRRSRRHLLCSRARSAAQKARNQPVTETGSTTVGARIFECLRSQVSTGDGARMELVIGPRLSAAGGGAITGIDPAKPLPPELKWRIAEAFRDHHVVVFPAQALSREQQYDFAHDF